MTINEIKDPLALYSFQYYQYVMSRSQLSEIRQDVTCTEYSVATDLYLR